VFLLMIYRSEREYTTDWYQWLNGTLAAKPVDGRLAGEFAEGAHFERRSQLNSTTGRWPGCVVMLRWSLSRQFKAHRRVVSLRRT
jgi:hypothetical protein